jgi:PAS domain
MVEARGHRLLGEILVDLGFTNLNQVNEARRRQMTRPNVLLGEYLIELGYVTPAQLLEALSRQAEDLCRGTPPPTLEELSRGLPARAFELCQLVSLPLFQAVAHQMEEGFYVEGWGERPSDDRLLFVNQALASWAGMRPEDFMGKPEITVVNFGARFFDDPEGFLRKVRESVHKRPEPGRLVFKISKPQPMEMEVHTFPLTNRKGEVIGAAGFLKPIS